MTDLCWGDEYTNLRTVFFIWDKKGKHKELGTVGFSLYDVATEKIWDYKIFSAKSIIGTFYVLRYEVIAKYTFLDYIFAGCDVSMVVGIDFTLDKTQTNCHDPKNQHYIPKFEEGKDWKPEKGKN